MARTWFKAKQLTRQTLTGTVTPASVLSLSFAYEASVRYHLLWSMQSDYSVNSRNASFALNDTTDAVGLAFPTVRPGNTADVFSVGGVATWTAPGSPGTRQFDVTQAPGNSADTVGSDDIFLMSIKEDASDEYAETLAATSTTSSTLSDRVTLTFTPATAGLYLILCSAEGGGLIPVTADGIWRVLLDVDGTEYFDTDAGYFAATSGTRMPWAGAVVVDLTAASHTLKIRYASSNGVDTANIRNARIVAMRLDTFGQATSDQDATEQSTQLDTYQVAAGVTVNAAARDYIVLGAGLVRNSTSARAMQAQMDIAGVSRSAANVHDQGNGGRYRSYIAFGYDTLAAGSRTIETEWKVANVIDTGYIVDAFTGAFLPDALGRSSIPAFIG